MKNSLKSLIICLILTIFTNVVILELCKNLTVVKAVGSAEIVMDYDSGRVLYGKNIDERLANASTTKIVTAITVLENADVNDKVLITASDVNVEGSSIYLKEGDIYTVEALLYGLMLRSGNDAATALCRHVGKTVENFSKLMNTVAKKCGAENSNFVNPHGLNDENHYTTAKDLALITRYALQNEVFKKIVSTKKITIDGRTFVNKNKMLNNYDGADGVKTGYTKKAGRCLVTTAKKEDMRLISVVLNCGDMYERSSKLLDECFNNYSMKEILPKNAVIGEIAVKGGLLESDAYIVKLEKAVRLPLSVKEKNNVRIETLLVKKLTFPLNNGIYIGNLQIFSDKDLIFSVKLFTINVDNNYSYSETAKGVFVRWRVYAH